MFIVLFLLNCKEVSLVAFFLGLFSFGKDLYFLLFKIFDKISRLFLFLLKEIIFLFFSFILLNFSIFKSNSLIQFVHYHLYYYSHN